MSVPDLEVFFGKYTGFMPSTESPVGLGEVEMVVGPDNIRIRHATGSGIEEAVWVTSEFTIIDTENTFKKLLKGGVGSEVSIGNIVGELRHRDGAPTLLFMREFVQGNPEMVMIQGTMADSMGPTGLFSQAEIEKGHLAQFINKLEEAYNCKGGFPRLSDGGVTRSQVHRRGQL